MKKVVVAATALAVGSFSPVLAHADTDVFGTQQQIDGSYELRRTTTEQFEPVRGQSVLARPRPDFDPAPVSVSSFNLYPSLDLGMEYNNNIFAQPKSQTTDTILSADPALGVLSNWSRHALAIHATGDLNYYAWDNHQNFNSATVQAEGRYDLEQKTWLAGTAGYQRVTELRGSPDTPASQAGPSQYNLYSGDAEINRGVGIVQAKANYDITNYEYSSVDLIGGGTASQSFRDRTQQKVGAEVSYNQIENLKPYIAGGYNWRHYSVDSQRQSNGFNVDVGARADFGGVTTAQAYVGYMSQDYYNFAHTTDALDFGADVLWNVTSLTSVEGKAKRSIEESTVGGAPSFVLSHGEVTVSHEMMRNVVLEGNVGYDNVDYQGIKQTEDFYNIGGGGRYYFNRKLHTDLTYNYQRKESSVIGQDFDQHVVMLRVGLQY